MLYSTINFINTIILSINKITRVIICLRPWVVKLCANCWLCGRAEIVDRFKSSEVIFYISTCLLQFMLHLSLEITNQKAISTYSNEKLLRQQAIQNQGSSEAFKYFSYLVTVELITFYLKSLFTQIKLFCSMIFTNINPANSKLSIFTIRITIH